MNLPNEMKTVSRENEINAPMFSRLTHQLQIPQSSSPFPISISFFFFFHLSSFFFNSLLFFFLVSFTNNAFNCIFQTQIQISRHTHPDHHHFSSHPQIPPPLHLSNSKFSLIRCCSSNHHR